MTVFSTSQNIDSITTNIKNTLVNLGYSSVKADTNCHIQNYLTVFCYTWQDGLVTFNFAIPQAILDELLTEYPTLEKFLSTFQVVTNIETLTNETPKSIETLYFEYPFHQNSISLPINNLKDAEFFYPIGLKIKDGDCVLFNSQSQFGIKPAGYFTDSILDKVTGMKILVNIETLEGRIINFKDNQNDFTLCFRHADSKAKTSELIKKTVTIFQEMSKQLNPFAMFNLFLWKQSKYYNFEQTKEANTKLLKKAANLGLLEAQKFYARRMFGTNEAIRILNQAVQSGDEESYFLLALHYHLGTGIEVDLGKADELYEVSSKNPFYKLTCVYNQYLVEDSPKFDEDICKKPDMVNADWLIAESNKNNVVAQFLLACLYDFGVVLDQNYEFAVHWYLKAAKQGYAKAQCNLADKYEHGKGIEQNYVQARLLYEQAAHQKISQACSSLSTIYREGLGIPIDTEKADYWHQKSQQP